MIDDLEVPYENIGDTKEMNIRDMKRDYSPVTKKSILLYNKGHTKRCKLLIKIDKPFLPKAS